MQVPLRIGVLAQVQDFAEVGIFFSGQRGSVGHHLLGMRHRVAPYLAGSSFELQRQNWFASAVRLARQRRAVPQWIGQNRNLLVEADLRGRKWKVDILGGTAGDLRPE